MTTELPEKLQADIQLYSGCISGASTVDNLADLINQAGFKNIAIIPKDESKEFIKEWAPDHNVEEYILSAIITAVK